MLFFGKKKEKTKGGYTGRIIFLSLIVVFFATGLFSFLYVETVILPEVKKTMSNISMEADDDHMMTTLYYKDRSVDDWVPMEILFAENNRRWVDYKFIPINIRNAAVAIEDKRFWNHSGVDWLRTGKAFWATMVKKVFHVGNVQGGSTITQQLIKNLTGNSQVTFKRKLCEIFEAQALEKKYSKEQILEAYLNKIYFGHNTYGIYRASLKYFGKDPDNLDLAESVLLVGVTNNPSYYDPYKYPEHLCQRAKLILLAMLKQDYISEEESEEALRELGYYGKHLKKHSMKKCMVTFHDESIGSKLSEADRIMDGNYGWYTDAVIEHLMQEYMAKGKTREQAADLLYNGGLSVYTAYDPDVQEAVEKVYREGYDCPSASGQKLESGITVIDNDTGAVVATVGAFGKKEDSRIWSHATQEVRAPASAIKPLSVYTPAMAMEYCFPDDTVYDKPFMKVDGKNWPRNDSGKYEGTMTLKKAVADSVNTVAVDLLDQIGLDTGYEWLANRFHLSHLDPKNDKGYAPLALGGLTKGVTTEEMASAYASFPRNGLYIPGYYYSMVEDVDGKQVFFHGDSVEEEQIFSEETANSMTEVMKEVVESGTGTDAKINRMAAGKTGTTNKRKDLWFCGYTEDYTAAIWVGYDKPESIPEQDVNIAADLWKRVMESIDE